jgi:hypothetical protein
MSAWVLPSAFMGFIVLAGGLHLVAVIIQRGKKEKVVNPIEEVKLSPLANVHENCERTINNLTSTVTRLEAQDMTRGVQLSAYRGEEERLKDELEKEKRWSRALTRELEDAQTEIASLKKPKLAFTIDEASSQVHFTGGGPQHRRIQASVKLRCEKSGSEPLGVRDFRAELCILGISGEKVLATSIPYKTIYDYPNMEPASMENGWIIREPISNYRWFYFHFEIPTEIDDALSRDHFFRVTMDVRDQEDQTSEFFVVSWRDAHTSNSDIKLKR